MLPEISKMITVKIEYQTEFSFYEQLSKVDKKESDKVLGEVLSFLEARCKCILEEIGNNE